MLEFVFGVHCHASQAFFSQLDFALFKALPCPKISNFNFENLNSSQIDLLSPENISIDVMKLFVVVFADDCECQSLDLIQANAATRSATKRVLQLLVRFVRDQLKYRPVHFDDLNPLIVRLL